MSSESLYDGGMSEYTYNATTGNYDYLYGSARTLKGDFGRTEVTSAWGGVAVIGTEVFLLCQTNTPIPGTYYARWYVYQLHWTGTTPPKTAPSVVNDWKSGTAHVGYNNRGFTRGPR